MQQSTQNKRSRAANWSNEEIDALLQECSRQRDVIVAKLSSQICNEDKKRAWHSVVTAVNAVNPSGVVRTEDGVMQKWTDLRSAAKNRVAKYKKEMGKTGGRTNTVKVPSQQGYFIIELMGTEAIEGIPGTEVVDLTMISQSQRTPIPCPSPSIPTSSVPLENEFITVDFAELGVNRSFPGIVSTDIVNTPTAPVSIVSPPEIRRLPVPTFPDSAAPTSPPRKKKKEVRNEISAIHEQILCGINSIATSQQEISKNLAELVKIKKEKYSNSTV